MVRDEFAEPRLREAIRRFDDAVSQVDAVADPAQRRLLDQLRHDQLRYVADAVIVGRVRLGTDAGGLTPEALVEAVQSATAELSAFLTEGDNQRLADAVDHVDRALLGVGATGSPSPQRGSHRRAESVRPDASDDSPVRPHGAPEPTPSTSRAGGRHSRRSIWPIVAFGIVAAMVAVIVFAVAIGVRGNDSPAVRPSPAAVGCTVLRIAVPASYQPALDAVADNLAESSTCVELDLTVADGRAAEGIAERERAHVWITDDAAWLELHEASEEYATAGESEGESHPVLATSPVVFVSTSELAAGVERAGGGWSGLATLVDAGRPVRIVTADPATSGDGLLAVGGVGDAIWDSQGMDASALLLAHAFQNHRTVDQFDGSSLTADEIALVPEHLLSDAAVGGNTVTVPSDRTVLMRYSWHPTEVDQYSSELQAARDQLLASLTAGPSSDEALATAHLRDAHGQPPSTPAAGVWVDDTLPSANPVMDAHRVGHVFATWYAKDRLADVLVVVDVSGSMAAPAPGGGRPLIDLVGDNVRQLAGQLPTGARLGVWGFGSQLDGQRDYVVVAPLRPLTSAHRTTLDARLDGLVTQSTGSGLHDTLLAAYRSALDSARPGVRFGVMVFTDGLNQDDPGSVSAGQLRTALAQLADPDVPVGLTLVKVGGDSADALERSLEPVGGEVVEIGSARDVVATFIHLAAGGLHE